jgi:hypothetical protein
LRIPRFEFPEIKLPRLNCALERAEKLEVAAEEVDDCQCGKVVYERNVSHNGYVKIVKYVKLPNRFLLKRVVTFAQEPDVEP